MGGKTSSASKNKWMAKAYDRINLTVPKGEKDLIKEHAEAFGDGSVNAFINRAITEAIVRDERRREKIQQETREQNPSFDDITISIAAADREEAVRITQMRLDALYMMKCKRAREAMGQEEE